MGIFATLLPGKYSFYPVLTSPTPPSGSVFTSYNLAVGNVLQPSTQVVFSPTSVSIPAAVAEPAALAPGDPNFQFQSGFTSGGTYTGTGTSVTAAISSYVTNTQTSANTANYPSVPVTAGQPVSVSVSASYTLSGNIVAGASGFASVEFDYSPDNGTTWHTLQYYSLTITPPSGSVSASPTLVATIATATNLNTIVFRIIARASAGGPPGTVSVTATGSIASSTITLTNSSSFTPYGGIPNYACPIPQILQFTRIPPGSAPGTPPAPASILILGNGYPPQGCDPSQLGGTTISALTNTWTDSYPAWGSGLAWVAGDQIVPAPPNYIFTAIQSGNSATSPPSWPTSVGATVKDGQVIWRNDGPLATSVAPPGAAHGIVYAGSLWLANTWPTNTADNIDGPTCLKMSDSNNPDSWNPVNTAFIGKDDGTQITGLATYTVAEVGIAPTGSLVVFKEYSTYQVIGVFGAQDFAITQAQTDLGCIAARSIQFLPGYGIIRLTHMGWGIFDGVKDRLVSEEIRPYIFGGTHLDADITGVDFSFCYLGKGTEVSSVPLYICALPLLGQVGSMTRLFAWDLVLKSWTIYDLPWPINTLMQARTGEGIPLLIAGRSDGTGNVERMHAGYVNGVPVDPAWDSSSLVPSVTASNTPITWMFRVSHVYSEGSSLHGFYRLVVIRGYATPPVAQTFTVSLEVDGRPFFTQAYWVNPNPTSGQFDTRVDIGITAVNVQMSVTGTGVVTIDALDWQVEAKPVPYVQLVAG